MKSSSNMFKLTMKSSSEVLRIPWMRHYGSYEEVEWDEGCRLFNIASGIQMIDQWEMIWKEAVVVWPRYYPSIWLRRLREAMKNPSQDGLAFGQDWNRAFSEYKSNVLPPNQFVRWRCQKRCNCDGIEWYVTSGTRESGEYLRVIVVSVVFCRAMASSLTRGRVVTRVIECSCYIGFRSKHP